MRLMGKQETLKENEILLYNTKLEYEEDILALETAESGR